MKGFIGGLLGVTVFSLLLLAAIPSQLNYQGKLTDPAGVALTGSHSITFRICDAASGGSVLWSETHTVTITRGLFDVVLGTTTPIDLPFDAPYWMELVVDGETLSPRQPLTSVGYSFRSSVADSAVVAGGGGGITQINGETGPAIGIVSGGAGIGVSTASNIITISNTGDVSNSNELQDISASGTGLSAAGGGTMSLTVSLNSGNSSGQIPISNGTLCTNLNADLLDGYTASDFAMLNHTHCNEHWTCPDSGLYIDATNGYGFYGTTSDSAMAGVRGDGGAKSAGVFGTSSYGSSAGVVGNGGTATAGVLGLTSAADDAGLWGIADTNGFGAILTGGRCGALGYYGASMYMTGSGLSGSSNSVGVYAYGDTTNGSVGLWARCDAVDGDAVLAVNYATSGFSYGVWAACSSGVRTDGLGTVTDLGVALYGSARDSAGIGVMGVGNNIPSLTVLKGGAGVLGNSNVAGVYGWGDSTSGSYGIYGQSNAPDGKGVVGTNNDLTPPSMSNGFGVFGYSDNVGVFGYGDTTDYSTGVYGTSDDTDNGCGVIGVSDNIGVYGRVMENTDAAENYAVFGLVDTTTVATDIAIYGYCKDVSNDWSGYFNGDIYIGGAIYGYDPKSAVIEEEDGWHAVYCQESPEVWFEDIGSGQLTNGKAYIKLADDFRRITAVNDKYPMRVFVQLTDPNCNGVAVVKHQDGFEVVELADGHSNATFDWRVVAKRRGYEDWRYRVVSKKFDIAPPNFLLKSTSSKKVFDLRKENTKYINKQLDRREKVLSFEKAKDAHK